MKKILLTLMAVVASISISAQTVKVYENGVLADEYYNTSTNTVKVVCMEEDDNITNGRFSVSASKKVMFTKGNLYWDGSNFRFESNQTDYPASWDANHVGHFIWTNLTDYQSNNAKYMPYAEKFAITDYSIHECWCSEGNPLTVEGITDLYPLSGGSGGEWDYLLNKRTNASKLYKFPVTVTNNGTEYAKCLIIAPDDFSGTLQSSYTLAEVNNLGLVCLPAAGYRNYGVYANYFEYWTSTYKSQPYAYYLRGSNNAISVTSGNLVAYGDPIRLVKTVNLATPTLTFAESNISITKGNTNTQTATTNSDGAITYKSSNTSVATVDATTGKVTAVAEGTATITATTATTEYYSQTSISYTVTVLDPNIIYQSFSVSASKKVQFTSGNLYWDGSALKFEANQTDYLNDRSWSSSHVNHFFWTNITDFKSGNASYMPYASTYAYSSQSTSDKFWCGESNPLTVEGISGLYVLTSSEWDYLFNTRTNASSLYKFPVTVGGKANCFIFAPDGFTGTLKSSYTLDEVNNLGLVCLPASGLRGGTWCASLGTFAAYQSATPDTSETRYHYVFRFSTEYTPSVVRLFRDSGYSIRLVRTAK